MRPPITKLDRRDTHRLIPARYLDRDESVLTRLTDDRADLQALFDLEGATNDRLLGEAGLLPGIGVRELVFGIPYAHVVNASFTHANPSGSRFGGSQRGVWYAGFSRTTSEREVAYHKGKQLQEIKWMERETFQYVDFVADFCGEFHDLRDDTRFKKYLDPRSYAASQPLAAELLQAGSSGLVYPSVRHKGGTCLACFRPALVNNVRKGASISFTFDDPFSAPEIREHARRKA
jgi:hypothetical protein